ncbi:MAG: DUF4131 domain-containing protein, partial [Chloroflexi bacterium]|nr:DUF4131 domain-containing protein [Chloroflexota bacterium]
MRLVYLSLAWVVGIYLGSRFDFPWAPLTILLAVSSFLTILSYRKKALFWGGLCLLLLLGGILRFHTVPEGDGLEIYRGFYELRGVVAAAPDVKDHSTTLRLEVKEIREPDGEW